MFWYWHLKKIIYFGNAYMFLKISLSICREICSTVGVKFIRIRESTLDYGSNYKPINIKNIHTSGLSISLSAYLINVFPCLRRCLNVWHTPLLGSSLTLGQWHFPFVIQVALVADQEERNIFIVFHT